MGVLLAAFVPREARAQSVESTQRLQRLVSAVHVRELRKPSPAPSLAVTGSRLTMSYRALMPELRSGLRQQIRLPLHRRADLTFGGRLGTFGLSSTARFRLHF